LAMNGVEDSYTRREIRLSFLSASNEVLTDFMNIGRNDGLQPRIAHVFKFPEKSTRRMRVRQIAKAAFPEQWNVHEMRFYSHGVEIARSPAWRLRAWPLPEDVQLAFDNSLITRWRSWETAGPGMYIDVDFGREESVDEVRVETSWDYLTTRLVAEFMNASGNWEKAGEVTQDVDIPTNPQARRMAIYELSKRGVHYLLFYDTDFGADDVRADPEAWGLQLIAADAGARLYKTTW